jgi:hypothetical protein
LGDVQIGARQDADSKHAKERRQMQVDAGGLDATVPQGVDYYAPPLYLLTDGTIAENQR